ncbi:MAG: 16S rRNA (adenine(1518)-N(6)/adenine(1519)-N(6))-dimethyltransferase, partial [Candidatus Sungbacteria bacterium]|nr:16S rRNA (adenine(1518)-N(6)/adenine(1519)-N(6))-dimethyltransferase [Candidatus Sungbacteria bacterium]
MIKASLKRKKSMGQYFLRCAWVIRALIDAAAITKKDAVVEIGSGHGELTRPLAAAAGSVVAVEKDERLALFLRDELAKKEIQGVEVIAADIRTVLRQRQWRSKTENAIVVGNIPYYLTSWIFRKLLEGDAKPKKIVFTVQKEVAERLVATPPDMNLLA